MMRTRTKRTRDGKRKRRKTSEGVDLSYRMLKRNEKSARSAITNGSALVLHADHRMPFMRRLKDLIEMVEDDCGGPHGMSNVEQVLVRRAAFLLVQAEMLESKCAQKGGAASEQQLIEYQRVVASVQRIYQTLLGKNGGLARRAGGGSMKNVSLREIHEAIA
jgi:hypothetical protein